MRLTRIEIHGFKSFADRTNLDLPPGLTAIVGPNGCGKSNVIDAVKWALGEQKASALRGGEMLDVVFKGNGASGPRNFAEVSLVFDNSDGVLPTDYSEVVLTRRLFRNGESEYLINRKTARLKDVRDLLMDTGLGTGAYSVMEQGRIDAILSANPHERRRIFEEAAGISKYRARRREAESKLNRTEQNLLRLGDVVEELERRQRSLKQQAGRARAYLENRDRIQFLKSRFYVHQYETYGTQLAGQQAAVGEAQEAAEQTRQAVEAVRAEVAVLQQKLTDARQQVDEAAEAFRQASGEVEALTERQTGLRERLAESVERKQMLEARLQGLEAAVAERRREVEAVDVRLASLDEEIVAAEAEAELRTREHAEVEARMIETRRQTEERRAQSLGRLEELTRARNARGEADNRRAALVASRDRLASQVLDLGAQQDQLSAVQGELFSGARDLEATLQVAQERLDTSRTRRDEVQADLAEADELLAERREDLAGNESHRKALDELIERREGVTAGALALLEAQLPGVEGLLVDSLRAPAQLAEAVEAALGASTQAVLVGSRASGLAALEHLRRVQGGRVLLVPRDGLRQREGAAAGQRLLDALEVREHREVFEALLGHVRLVDSRDALLHQAPDGVTVWVTPDGDLLDERGVLRGGQGTGAEEGGLLSRRAERDALAAQCDRLRDDIGKLGAARAGLSHEVDRLEEATRAAETHLRRLEVERDRTSERKRESAQRQRAVHREMASRTSDRRDVEAELDEVEAALAGHRMAEQQLEAAVEEDKREDARFEVVLHELRDELTARHEVLAHARTELSTRKERREALASERRQVERGLEERVHDQEVARQELTQLADRTRSGEEELQRLEERAAALSEERDRRAGALGEAREAAALLTQQQQEIQERVTAAEAAGERAATELSTRRLEAQETDIRRKELRRQVLEELEVDLDEPQVLEEPAEDEAGAEEPAEPVPTVEVHPAVRLGEACAVTQDEQGRFVELDVPVTPVKRKPLPTLEDGSTDWPAVEAEIEELRGRLSRMGNVNLEAVDELAAVEERLNFLVNQRDDLIEAQRSLIETIQKVNKQSRERFETTFAEVREHFRAIFRKLFRGGKADITLEEGEDILEAGIEITAAPPGKDARTITLLSGGERTLTAVGMLFALFKARPSPVCLLDEVDAALDETNIDRFCTVLEDFLGQSQFIVVTHARRTMSYSDTVFGVTMQEHGVSKVLSLSLEEYDAQQKRGPAAALAPPADAKSDAGSGGGNGGGRRGGASPGGDSAGRAADDAEGEELVAERTALAAGDRIAEAAARVADAADAGA